MLLLCNDKAVLGPWTNGRWINLFTGTVIGVLVMLSIVLTASVLYPEMSETTILAILGIGGVFALGIAIAFLFVRREGPVEAGDQIVRATWRMPPLNELPTARMTPLTRVWMVVLRGYLVVAGGLVLLRIVQLFTRRPVTGAHVHSPSHMVATSVVGHGFMATPLGGLELAPTCLRFARRFGGLAPRLLYRGAQGARQLCRVRGQRACLACLEISAFAGAAPRHVW